VLFYLEARHVKGSGGFRMHGLWVRGTLAVCSRSTPLVYLKALRACVCALRAPRTYRTVTCRVQVPRRALYTN